MFNSNKYNFNILKVLLKVNKFANETVQHNLLE